MTIAYLLPTFGAGFQGFNNQGIVLAGGLLYTQVAGSVNTPLPSYTDSTATTLNANPIVLGSNGRPAQEIWVTAACKIVLTDSAGGTIGTWDYVPGVNGITAVPQSEWTTSGLTPTYINATQFTLVGNQIALFPQGTRVRFKLAGGTYYSYVSSSSFDLIVTTTVNLVNDTNGMDNTLTTVDYGFLSATNPSVPQQFARGMPYADVTNTADAFTGAYMAPASLLYDGAPFVMGVSATNTTTTPTFAPTINGVLQTVRVIKKYSGTSLIALSANDLPGFAELKYESGTPCWVLMNPTTVVGTFVPTGVTVTLAGTISGGTYTSPTLSSPALGTPASGVLTNCTGLPATSIVAGTAGINISGNAATATTATNLLGGAVQATQLGFQTGVGVGGSGSVSIGGSVTINTMTGQISVAAYPYTGGTAQAFTVNNSNVATTDIVVMSLVSSTSPSTVAPLWTYVYTAGHFVVYIYPFISNSPAMVLNFAIIKGSIN